MRYIEAKVTFNHPDPELAGDLIAGVFFDFDLQGVVVEDPTLEPAEEWAEDAVARPAAHAVVGYLPEDEGLDRCRLQLDEEVGRLGNHIGLIYRFSYRRVDEEDWAESWKAFFWPQKIGERIVVKPSWRDYGPQPGEIVIEIDPGMAFGTGTHPTTALCVRLIEKWLAPGASFLDVGTGSGILMIAAAMLGAGRLCGGDRDGTAVRIAAENLRRNQVGGDRFQLAQGSLAGPFRGRFDIVCANILTPVILELLEDLPRVLKKGGSFICSGVIAENEALVVERMKATGFEIAEVLSQEGWVAIVGQYYIGSRLAGSRFTVKKR
ncbi:MAG: 50S ribosomal protein L11 methyltransferase [Desulfobacteraceae bacterium]|nr:MAG: 50S ribosomal protein L11 methyltransferase [Desulfobacteraceae bacterium]